jgi:tetratricopeptide (TPR) repeat protein
MRPQPGLATKPAPMPGLNRPDLSNRPTTLPGQVGSGGLATRPTTRPSPPAPGLGNRPGGGDRPGLGNVQRPTTLPGQLPGGIAGNRPGAGGNRPAMGGNRPTTLPGDLGNRPGMGGNRPTTLPGDLGNRPGTGGNRPVTLPGDLANRPGNGGDRPGIGGNRPGIGGDRPGLGGGTRPGIGGERPVTLPGDLANRPSGGGNRPWTGGNRPGIDGDRPWNAGNRPGIGGNRPGIGDGNNFWNSGNIGSGIGSGNIGSGNWVHNNTSNNFNNINVGGGWGLGGYGFGYGNGFGYGGGYGGWANHWNNGYINPHYGGWYNGCWGGNWGYNGGWWAPFAVGAATWGLASTLGSWGWGYGAGGYVNPYYSAVPAAVVAASPYDYSQPVIVNNYVTNDGDLTDASTVQGGTASSAAAPSDATFDAALAAFKQGDYTAALAGCDKAVKQAPNDSVIHEVRALALFALGRYPEAAATLNAVLAVAPGMDWTTMSSLYGSVDTYTGQLRKLEDFCRANPDNAAGYFLLGYHYLVGGHAEMAANALRVVVEKQPGDVVAKRLLDALTPKADQPADPPPAAPPEPAAAPAAAVGPETDLVGNWKATAGKDSVDLVISEDSQFTWKATPDGRQPVAISGMIETARDAIALVSESAGTMTGKVTSKGADAFEFMLAGAPADAKPIVFQRQVP